MNKLTAIRTAALGAALCASGAFGATTSESIEAVVYRDVNCLAVSLSGIAETRSLWVAMDATDKGETAADWSHWCHAADVAAGTTAVEVVLPDTTAVKNGKMLRCALLPLCGAAAFVWDGVFIGLTYTRGMLWAVAVADVLFFVLYYLLPADMGNHGLWLAFVTFLAVRGVVQTVLYSSKIRPSLNN